MEHVEGRFEGHRNTSLYYQAWLPSGAPKAILAISHGLAEHSGRYGNLVSYFVPRGYTVWAVDHRGHGKSEGKRGNVGRFTDYVSDLAAFVAIARGRNGDRKSFLIGHSVGGTIAVAYAIDHQAELAGLILSAPTILPGSSVSQLDILTARLLSIVAPGIGVAPIDAGAICKDSAVVNAYINDPLVYRGKICARLGSELVCTMKNNLPLRIPALNLPVLIMHGTADRVSNPEGSKLLYGLTGSGDKLIKWYDGLYHELFNEPEHERVFADMESWLAARV